ncbi:MAG: cell envelope integrity protein TolA [Caldimonas sp.]
MNAAVLERDLFAPQQPPGMRSGLALAILAHVLLIVALTFGVNWKASEPEGVVAELWSSVPQAAAPRAATPPEPRPPPAAEATPPPKPEPVLQPKPAPFVKPEPEPAPAPRADAQIAIERAARERARKDEAERVEAARQIELKKRADAKRDEAQRAEARRLEAEKKQLAEQAEQKKLAEQAKADEARQAAIREANLRKMMKDAGSSDDPLAAGTAARTSGPSSGYAGRIKARVKPNIVLTAALDGNPAATVEVRVAPDGTIVGRKLVKSSGSAVWDQTVLRAIDKTEVLPRDVDGTIPPTIEISFRPRD